MALLDELKAHRKEILTLAEECGLENVRVFGSVARGEESDESDIDLLVNYIPNSQKGLKVFRFPIAIENIMGRKVDLVFEAGLYHQLRNDILKEATPI